MIWHGTAVTVVQGAVSLGLDLNIQGTFIELITNIVRGMEDILTSSDVDL